MTHLTLQVQEVITRALQRLKKLSSSCPSAVMEVLQAVDYNNEGDCLGLYDGADEHGGELQTFDTTLQHYLIAGRNWKVRG